MNLDVESLIMFFKKNTKYSEKEEFSEEDTASTSSSSGGGAKPMPKWTDSYPTKRGKSNMLGLKGEKWDSGVARTGPANKIW
jgi:hypothetical protein